MSDHSFDLIVIGTGPSAGTVARKTEESGKSVAVIESRGYGGTCALRGADGLGNFIRFRSPIRFYVVKDLVSGRGRGEAVCH